MNFKKLLILGILLVILSAGAVSAQENVDVLGDDSYWDDDFYITVKENYDVDKQDWQDTDLIYISSSSNQNGTFHVLVGDVEKQSILLTDGYFSSEVDEYGSAYNKYYTFIYPGNLSLDFGSYNIKVNFNDRTLLQSSVVLKQKEDFDIYLSSEYYCLKEYWDSPSFIIIDSNHFATGTLEVLVNNTKKIEYSVENGYFENRNDTSNKSRYLSCKDLNLDYGKYNIKITFNNNILKEENVLIAEYPPQERKIELYFDLYIESWPADNRALIYLPRNATGTLTLTLNGNDIPIDYKNAGSDINYENDMVAYRLHVWDLKLGNNTVNATYTDSEGELVSSGSFEVIPSVYAPAYVSAGEKFIITIKSHEWSAGTFNIYDGNLIASNTIASGQSSIELSFNKLGYHNLTLEFLTTTGNYNITNSILIINNSKNINVTVSKTSNSATVKITAPNQNYTYVNLVVDDKDAELIAVEDGRVEKTISNLDDGYHTISVKYNNGYLDENGEYVTDIYSETFTIAIGDDIVITAPDINKYYGGAERFKITLTKDNMPLADAEIIITVNGLNIQKPLTVMGWPQLH